MHSGSAYYRDITTLLVTIAINFRTVELLFKVYPQPSYHLTPTQPTPWKRCSLGMDARMCECISTS